MIVDINGNFEELNPIIAVSQAIQELKKHLKSDQYNKCLWSIFMLEHPLKRFNPKADMPRADKLRDIRIYYPEFNPEDPYVEAAINDFAQHCLTFEQYMFKIQRDKLEEFTLDFKNMDVASKDFVDRAKVLKPLWENFDKIRKDMLKIESEDTAMGDITLSKAEKRRSS